jgi:hypothetical protein
MSEKFDPLKIPIEIDDSKIISQMANVGKSIEKSSIGAKAALWGVGEQAGDLARSLGLPAQMARKLEDVTESMAAKLGKGAVAFGALGLAVTAGVAIWKSYSDAQKKAAEETIKAATAAGTWIESALKEQGQTKELTAAKRQLAEAEFDLNRARAQQGIPVLVEQVKQLTEEYNKLVDVAGGENTPFFAITKKGENVAEAAARKAETLKLSINETVAQLRILRAQESLFTAGNKGTVGENAANPKKKENGDVTVTNEYARESAYQAQLLDLYRATGASKDEIWQQELAAFDWATAAKMASATSEQDYYDTLALREMERTGKVAEHERRQDKLTNDQKLAMASQTAGNVSQIGQLMASQGGKNARKWFTLQKSAATAEAIINTYQGATKAMAQGGIYGGVLAASIVALGMAQVAKIRSQTFDGGGGATGTFAANPTTGMPQQDNYRYFNYEQSTYGSGWRPGESGQGGNTTIIYAMDSKDVERVMMENAGSVKKANDHAEKGYA